MGFTDGVDKITGDLVSEPDWNNYMGAAGSINHLHDVACQIWVPVTQAKTGGVDAVLVGKGNFAVANLTGANDRAIMNFFVPAEYSSLTSAEIIVIPKTTDGAVNWDLYSDYGAVGQAFNTHDESDLVTTYDVTADQLFAVDASGVLTSLAANDFVGLQLLLGDAADDLYVIGALIKYVSA